MLEQITGELISDLGKQVARLEAICEEQDKRIDELEQQLCNLKESVGGNSGVVYGHYFDPVSTVCVGGVDLPVSVNVAEVSTSPNVTFDVVTKPENLDKLSEPDVTMKDSTPVYLDGQYDGPVGP